MTGSRQRSAARRGSARAALCATLLLLGAVAARAQTVDTQIDITASQSDASQTINRPLTILNGGESAQFVRPKGNYLVAFLQLPYTFDSNPALANTATQNSWRFDPSANLGVQQQFGPLLFTASSAFDIDRYPDAKSADAETWLSSARLALTLWGGYVKPYAQYQPVLKYVANFSSLKSETNDYGGGIDFTIPALENGSADADLGFTRRYAAAGDSDAASLKTTLGYVMGPLRFLFQPVFRIRWYDTVAGSRRIDDTIIAPAIVEYDPGWLKLGNGLQGDIQLSATYTENFSTVATNHAAQWIVGPTLEFGLAQGWAFDPLE
ncbi:MAG TPA: hypothetical protein VNU97_15175 [Rhizomicrobium sp.]|jgi:hypothetical protein|nr:hypothetical protein [Rhizomicrobium sp.]